HVSSIALFPCFITPAHTTHLHIFILYFLRVLLFCFIYSNLFLFVGFLTGGGVVSKVETDDSDDSNLDSELSSHSLTAQYQTVIPAGTIQLSQGEGVGGLHTLTMTNATTAGGETIVQYTQAQDGQFFVPGEIVVTQGSGSLSGGSPIIAEDQQRKRELRLLKNREAARECRRKKKEYIKCLENRVAVLENQNKALIDELKSLKELYCQQKTD
ncbi:cyclic AMP-responsive element-binding protein 1-like, partial [Nilaparvata lugens]|uniref:cyclic AMP-responsive element-binding protein 1-like n=1 Tax=Nilaparvata lugens TaxID=108931 RepID=UPI00193D73B0